jgi:hypothetical protein
LFFFCVVLLFFFLLLNYNFTSNDNEIFFDIYSLLSEDSKLKKDIIDKFNKLSQYEKNNLIFSLIEYKYGNITNIKEIKNQENQFRYFLQAIKNEYKVNYEIIKELIKLVKDSEQKEKIFEILLDKLKLQNYT